MTILSLEVFGNIIFLEDAKVDLPNLLSAPSNDDCLPVPDVDGKVRY